MRFQKLFSGTIALLILVAQMGIALHVHYCAGEVASVETVVGSTEFFKDVEQSCCGKSEVKPKKMSCCDDKQLTFKDTSAKVLVKNIAPDFHFVKFEIPGYHFQTVLATPSISSQVLAYYCDAHGPPLYQLYSQFVFYA
ncbi:HYC_CC_PP family protein [Flavobacterium stagni]|uniref:Uncharacterized protein n=1 Tax=Flavobacterium stagni TaxID=2506421 RepID=A0A4Q1KBC1_9FLAO|nr:hypothetical protein [Flavobacterium stagni]RXR23901.1 hypothetical protein EQG61_00225 [Flavobacterium stagni]